MAEKRTLNGPIDTAAAALQHLSHFVPEVRIDAAWDYHRLEAYYDTGETPLLILTPSRRADSRAMPRETLKKVISSAFFQAQCGFGVYFDIEFKEAGT